MTPITLLFVFGIILLVLDLFVPGIILSVAGTLVFLAATARAFGEYGIGGGLLAFAIAVVLLAVTLYVEYWILPKTSIGKKFFLHAAVHGTSQAPSEQSSALAGKEGVALTPLMPSGQIEIAGRRYEALSLDGHMAKGARLKVTGMQNFSLTVTHLP